MLGKLLKHDLKSYVIPMAIAIGALIVISIVTRFTLTSGGFYDTIISDGTDFLETMSIASILVAYFVAIVVAVVMPFILIARRFYTNLLCEEGYLTNTLPVKPTTQLYSKIISAFIIQLAVYITCVISVIVAFNVNGLLFDYGWSLFDQIIKAFSFDNIGVTAIYLFYLLASMIYSIMAVFTALCLGHQANKHRFLASVGIYIGISIIVSILSSVFGALLSMMISDLNTTAISFLTYSAGFVGYIALSVGGYIICRYVLDKHLNLD